jgi:hypothetical protein
LTNNFNWAIPCQSLVKGYFAGIQGWGSCIFLKIMKLMSMIVLEQYFELWFIFRGCQQRFQFACRHFWGMEGAPRLIIYAQVRLSPGWGLFIRNSHL